VHQQPSEQVLYVHYAPCTWCREMQVAVQRSDADGALALRALLNALSKTGMHTRVCLCPYACACACAFACACACVCGGVLHYARQLKRGAPVRVLHFALVLSLTVLRVFRLEGSSGDMGPRSRASLG